MSTDTKTLFQRKAHHLLLQKGVVLEIRVNLQYVERKQTEQQNKLCAKVIELRAGVNLEQVFFEVIALNVNSPT